jgi:hypothetical protein
MVFSSIKINYYNYYEKAIKLIKLRLIEKN